MILVLLCRSLSEAETYRDKHRVEGRARVGFYYGYDNVDEKADYDATYNAIEEFMSHFHQ